MRNVINNALKSVNKHIDTLYKKTELNFFGLTESMEENKLDKLYMLNEYKENGHTYEQQYFNWLVEKYKFECETNSDETVLFSVVISSPMLKDYEIITNTFCNMMCSKWDYYMGAYDENMNLRNNKSIHIVAVYWGSK